jgi:hypothetical protein
LSFLSSIFLPLFIFSPRCPASSQETVNGQSDDLIHYVTST